MKAHYPQARCALNFHTTFQLLVAVILSAQCTDKRVNTVTEKLFTRYQKPADYAACNLAELEKAVYSTGFYRNKARNIRAAAQIIMEKFQGHVPDNMADLLTLPGVARKTANVVLSVGFGKNEGIVVDTHVSRLCRRLSLTAATNAVAVEKDLLPLLPRRQWGKFSHLLIEHGRSTCLARRPQCNRCFLSSICPTAGKNFSKKSPLC